MAGLSEINEEKPAGELKEAQRKPEDVNSFGVNLIATVSHEMRAPLAVIKGYASLLREGHCGAVDEKAKEILKKIEVAVDELVETISNVVDLRKVEEGKMEYEFSQTDLVGLAKDVAEGFHPLADGKKITLTFGASARDIFVNADPTELKHAIRNLVDNAVKYTPQVSPAAEGWVGGSDRLLPSRRLFRTGGSEGAPRSEATPQGFVEVKVEEKGNEVVFSVRDSGIGFVSAANPLHFKEYIRDARVKKEVRGSGIGLHIARSIVEAHGGKIQAESGGEGQGSTFSFSLPKIK
jgi:two-component system phosphate regulon sensor histidine kinase PhoR